MGLKDHYLFPSLDAGSSRVFNICARSAQLVQKMRAEEDDSEPKFLFNTHELNQSVLVKEVRTDRKGVRYEYANAVGTKLFLPYNPDRLYEGGKSAFLDDPRIEDIMRDHMGIDVSSSDAGVRADLKIVRLLAEIPSLDSFLVKDKLRVEGIDANEFYFEISEVEWNAIKIHVSGMLKPVIDFAFQESEHLKRDHTMTLVSKLWETKDMATLMPIINAFNLPLSEAKGIFAAWKGILYYDYEYSRCRAPWSEYGQWLEDGAIPLDYVDLERKQILAELRSHILTQYRAAVLDLSTIFASYEAAYNTLFVQRQDAGPFLNFMRNAVHAYWTLGTKMSAVNHCVTVWDVLTSRGHNRRLRYEALTNLFDLQREIFTQIGASQDPNAAMASAQD